MPRKLEISRITAKSSDEEILAAINAAGEHRYNWRKTDHPKKGENNTKSWVIPNDIGYSTRDDTSLLKRLREMVRQGLLEQRYGTSREVWKNNYPCEDTYTMSETMPRFRTL